MQPSLYLNKFSWNKLTYCMNKKIKSDLLFYIINFNNHIILFSLLSVILLIFLFLFGNTYTSFLLR